MEQSSYRRRDGSHLM